MKRNHLKPSISHSQVNRLCQKLADAESLNAKPGFLATIFMISAYTLFCLAFGSFPAKASVILSDQTEALSSLGFISFSDGLLDNLGNSDSVYKGNHPKPSISQSQGNRLCQKLADAESLNTKANSNFNTPNSNNVQQKGEGKVGNSHGP